MKLYTEEQVKRAMLEYSSYSKPTMIQVIDTLKPIELPSDEEIEEEMPKRYFGLEKEGFLEGAKWMKSKILGNNHLGGITY